jgi:hypothetical protein
MAAELHLAENALALHFFLERFESLIDIIVANENLHAKVLAVSPRHRQRRRTWANLTEKDGTKSRALESA